MIVVVDVELQLPVDPSIYALQLIHKTYFLFFSILLNTKKIICNALRFFWFQFQVLVMFEKNVLNPLTTHLLDDRQKFRSVKWPTNTSYNIEQWTFVIIFFFFFLYDKRIKTAKTPKTHSLKIRRRNFSWSVKFQVLFETFLFSRFTALSKQRRHQVSEKEERRKFIKIHYQYTRCVADRWGPFMLRGQLTTLILSITYVFFFY